MSESERGRGTPPPPQEHRTTNTHTHTHAHTNTHRLRLRTAQVSPSGLLNLPVCMYCIPTHPSTSPSCVSFLPLLTYNLRKLLPRLLLPPTRGKEGQRWSLLINPLRRIFFSLNLLPFPSFPPSPSQTHPLFLPPTTDKNTSTYPRLPTGHFSPP